MRFWTREIENFNPHSHKGSDNHITTNDNRRVDFNPHSHKGSDRLLLHKSLYVCNFNPHSHKGSDMGNEIFGYKVDISIHTPTRGVTWCSAFFACAIVISIHTPTRGVTADYNSQYASNWFQSTLPQGEWRPLSDIVVVKVFISIHTPTRGVTWKSDWRFSFWNNFNPHSHKGSDLSQMMLKHLLYYFNPHSHKGSDVTKVG